MRNPLNKRLPRELKSEIGKYIVLFIFLAGMISIVSGFIVAASSMSKAYDESFDKYNIAAAKDPGRISCDGIWRVRAPEIQRPPAGAGGILPQGELCVFSRSDGHR